MGAGGGPSERGEEQCGASSQKEPNGLPNICEGLQWRAQPFCSALDYRLSAICLPSLSFLANRMTGLGLAGIETAVPSVLLDIGGQARAGGRRAGRARTLWKLL